MKVAFVVHQYPPRYSTGTEIYAHRLALALREREHDVRVFTHDPDPRQQIAFRTLDDEVDGVPVTRLTFFEGLVPNHALTDYYNVFLGKVFGEWLDEVQPELVHVFHLMGLGLSLVEECRLRGIPVYVQMMDYWFLCPTVQLLRHDGALCDGPETNACVECLAPNNFGYHSMRLFGLRESFVESHMPDPEMVELNNAKMGPRRAALHGRSAFIRKILDKADGLVAPSHFIERFFRERGYADARIQHLPYGVDLPEGKIAKSPVRGEGTITFGFFGSVNPQKGLEVLVAAFRELRSSNAQLVVRGNMSHFPKYAQRVRSFAEMDPRISFKGPFSHAELASALGSIDVLVVPSVWYENTPFVVLEAFCAGRPVIASDLGGLSEIVRDGVNGRTFRTGDPGTLLEVLNDFVEDPQLLGRLAGGIGKVRTLDENAQEFVKLWQTALAVSGRS